MKRVQRVPNKHKKIRAGKPNSQGLESFPSVQLGKRVRTKKYKSNSCFRRLMKFFIWLLSIIVFLLLLLFAALKVGISGQILTSQMQYILSTQFEGLPDIKISEARLSLDSSYHIALEAKDVKVETFKNGVEMGNLSSFKLGLSLWPLVLGKIDVQQLEVNKTKITLPQSDDNSGIWKYLPKNTDGQLDADEMQALLFNRIDDAFSVFDKQAIHSVLVKDLSFVLPSSKGGEAQQINIKKIFIKNGKKGLFLSSEIDLGKEPISIEGRVVRNPENKVESLDFSAHNFLIHLGAADDITPFLPNGHTNNMYFKFDGAGSLKITAKRSIDDTVPSSFNAVLSVPGGLAEIGVATDIKTTLSLNLEYIKHSNKIAVLASMLDIGGLSIPLEGSISLINKSKRSLQNSSDYQFEFSSSSGISAPTDSDENPLIFNAYIQGVFDVNSNKIGLNKLKLTTPSGELKGQGSLLFGEGSPQTDFFLQTSEINISEAKQLWPINIAGGGRDWVLDNILGGKLIDSSIKIALPLGFFKNGTPERELSVDEIKIVTAIKDGKSKTFGELPSLHDIDGSVLVEGQKTKIEIKNGIATLENGGTIQTQFGKIFIPWGQHRPVYTDLEAIFYSDVKSSKNILLLEPLRYADKLPFDLADATGDISASIKLKFPIANDELDSGKFTWKSNIGFKNFSLSKPLNGALISKAEGTVHLDQEGVQVVAKGTLDEYPASLDYIFPFDNSPLKIQEKVTVSISDALRKKHLPFLDTFLSGPIGVEVNRTINGMYHVKANLTNAILSFPWVGWKKGKGVEASAEFDLPENFTSSSSYTIGNFILRGANINLAGQIQIEGKQLKSADFKTANLNRDDNMAVSIVYDKKTYKITTEGSTYDARALIKNLENSGGGGPSGEKIIFSANIKKMIGFNNVTLFNVTASYEGKDRENNLTVTSLTGKGSGMSVSIVNKASGNFVHADSADAGALLSFMDYYDKLHGGTLMARLTSDSNNSSLRGPVTIRKFVIIDEPRLKALVANTSSNKGPNPNNPDLISSKVPFDFAFAKLEKGDSYLVVNKGILRGPSVGTSFQGIIYDSAGNTAVTGTFMPAYGLNRLFGNVPILGQVLGNGRDGGLIGITFKIEGNIKSPKVTVNPVSAIAPGIFRQIFEFQ